MVNKTLDRTKMAMKSWFIVLYIVRTFCGYQRSIQKRKFKKNKQYTSQKERTTIEKMILKHEKENYRLSNTKQKTKE